MGCAVSQPRMFVGDMCNNFWFLSPLTYMHTDLPENLPVVTLILAVGLETVKIQFGFDLPNSPLAGHPVPCPWPGIRRQGISLMLGLIPNMPGSYCVLVHL